MGRLIEEQSFENFDLSVYSHDHTVSAKMQNVVMAAKAFATEFGKKRGRNLLLMGNTGTGKTHVSTSIAKRLIESERVFHIA